MKTTYNLELIHDPSGGIERLIEIMRYLRDPKLGCPWDVEQTLESLAPYALEEAYEVVDAIECGDLDRLPGELGDLLLQTIFQSEVAQSQGLFEFHDVVSSICNKLIDRHPHVFGDESREKSAEQQVKDWEKIKEKERGQTSRILDGVALNLPALTRAEKLQKRAARVGFDWPDNMQVLDKIREECEELVQAKRAKQQADIEEEFGDLLFTVVNLGRHLQVNSEDALRAANLKFTKRFNVVEDHLTEGKRTFEEASLCELEAIWQTVKKSE